MLAAIACAVLGSGILGHCDYRKLLSETTESLDRVCEAYESDIALAATSSRPRAAKSLARIHSRIERILHDLTHFSVIGLTAGPRPLINKGMSLDGEKLVPADFVPGGPARHIETSAGNLLVRYARVRDSVSGEYVAVVRLGVKIPTASQFLVRQLQHDVLSIFLPLAIFGITTAFLVASFTRPLRSVASYAQAIERGQAHEKLTVSGKDEARTIAEALNIVLHRLKQSYVSTLAALATLLESKDPSTESHSMRGVGYALELGRTVGLTEQELMDLEYGAYLHDIGKVAVDDSILKKTGALTEEDWRVMRQHPAIGYAVLKNLEFLQSALPVVLYHQERYDGTGYPHGVKGEEIPLLARIFAIADAFDAMTSNRPYRRAMKPEQAIDEIRRNAGGQFDPHLSQVFITLWEKGRLDNVKGQPGFDVLSEFRST